ncbi:MAG: SprT family zinc-dependent metalloprotease [Sphingomicrobium sp.]
MPISIRPIRRARRMRLRLDEAEGRLTLTCPWRTSRRTALAWAIEQSAWIDAQIERTAPGRPFAPGASIPVEGAERTILWNPDEKRQVVLDGGTLHCGGPEAGLARRIETFLKAHALATMSMEVAEYAALAGVTARSVRVGDPKSRWGSCSSNGRIRLSWRLILAPPEVRRFVVAHEVAHLRHLDHGPAFKTLEAELVGAGVAEARAALRRLGPGLRRVGRLGL